MFDFNIVVVELTTIKIQINMVHDAVFYDLHLGSGYTFISIGK